MPAAVASPETRRGIQALVAFAAALFLALWVGRAPAHVPFLAVGVVILFFATLLHAEAGLVILILSMLLSPELALGNAGGAGLQGSRDVVLRTEDLILLLVGLAWIARMAIHKDLGAIRRTRLNAFIGAYIASCLLSTLIGIETGRVRAVVGLCYVAKYVEYFILFFITVNYVRSPRQLRRLLAAVLITAALIVLYAYWQIPSGIRPSAPFEGSRGEPNTLGGYLVMMIAVSAAIALTVHSWIWMEVQGPDGEAVTWGIEGGPPVNLFRNGVTKATLPVGSEIKIFGYQAKSGESKAVGVFFEYPDGRKIFMGGSAPGADGRPVPGATR